MINENAVEFKNMGYNVQTKQKDIRFKLPGGRKKQFDLLLEKEEYD